MWLKNVCFFVTIFFNHTFVVKFFSFPWPSNFISFSKMPSKLGHRIAYIALQRLLVEPVIRLVHLCPVVVGVDYCWVIPIAFFFFFFPLHLPLTDSHFEMLSKVTLASSPQNRSWITLE